MIVVFGSVNVDFVTRVARLPRPGETVLGSTYEVFPGGKGANQALAARRAGAEVAFVGAVGDDAFAEPALRLLAQDGVDLRAMGRHAGPTGAAFIAVDESGGNSIVVAAGANVHAEAAQLDSLSFGAGDTLLLQREVPDAEGEAAAVAAKRRGGGVVLNLAPGGAIAKNWLRALDVLIMNETEAALLAAALRLGVDSPDAIAQAISREHGISVIVTLGAEGVIGWHDGKRHTAAPLTVEVVDTTAAGDAFVGAAAASLDRTSDFAEAIRKGIAAGSLACTKRGAQPSLPRAADIDAAAAEVRVLVGDG